MLKKQLNYKNLPEGDIVIEYIKKRKKKGLYSLILTTGLPGTGKSSIDLRLAELTSIELAGKNLITANNVVDDILDLIKFIKESNPKDIRICVIEEISVLFPSRRAMSHDNVTVGKLLDTARKKQVIIFANAPIFPAIDSHMRALGNIYIETMKINKQEKVVTAKALRMQTNPSSGKTYFHWLRRKGKEVHRIFIKKPDKNTWLDYENRKDKFLDELYLDLKEKVEKKNKKKIKIPKKEFISPREIQSYELVVRKGLTQTQAAQVLKVKKQLVSSCLKNIKKKLGVDNLFPENYKPNKEKIDISKIKPPKLLPFDYKQYCQTISSG